MPDQFWSLTYREFEIKRIAFAREERRKEWLIGRLALLTKTYKKKYRSPDDLLGYRDMKRYPEKKWLKSST